MSVRLKHGIALAVSIGIIYLLLSPAPLLNSGYSGKFLHNGGVLVIHALAEPVWLLLVSGMRPMKAAALARDDVLDRICVRLC